MPHALQQPPNRLRDYLFVGLQYLLPHHLLSALMFRITRSRLRWFKDLLIRQVIRLYRVEMSEAANPDPAAYPSFNAFFTRALADLLRIALGKLYVGLHDPAYNLIIRSAPVKEISNDYLHWYVTIIPRLSRTAGFEMGSGMYINPALPEESAAFLREAEV